MGSYKKLSTGCYRIKVDSDCLSFKDVYALRLLETQGENVQFVVVAVGEFEYFSLGTTCTIDHVPNQYSCYNMLLYTFHLPLMFSLTFWL